MKLFCMKLDIHGKKKVIQTKLSGCDRVWSGMFKIFQYYVSDEKLRS